MTRRKLNFERNDMTEPLNDTEEQLRTMQREMDALRVALQDTARQQATSAPVVAPVHRLQINVPKFTRSNPQLWFAQVERAFRLNSIINDVDKFDLITVQLEEDIALSVADLVQNPPDVDKYPALKARLLTKFAESAESMLRRLLHGGATGKKPSDILAHMRRLAPGEQYESIIRTLFLAEMPSEVRPILSVWPEADLDRLAATADRMLEANGTSDTCAAAATPDAVNAIAPTKILADVAESLRSLSERVEKLQREMKYLKQQNQSQGQSHDLSNGGNDQASTMCFYHKKFGDKAQKCRPGCTYKANLN